MIKDVIRQSSSGISIKKCLLFRPFLRAEIIKHIQHVNRILCHLSNEHFLRPFPIGIHFLYFPQAYEVLHKHINAKPISTKTNNVSVFKGSRSLCATQFSSLTGNYLLCASTVNNLLQNSHSSNLGSNLIDLTISPVPV